jgi:hypothetical protein
MPTPDDPKHPSERTTLVECLACEGHALDVCPWCTAGTMTLEQLAKWMAHQEETSEKP